MTYPTFSPPVAPNDPLEDTVAARRISAQFGDGYSQIAVDGLNAEQSNVNLTFSPLSTSQRQTIETFLENNAGLMFYYALPADGVTRIWAASSWTSTRQDTHYSLQVSLIQQFPLGG